MLLEAQNLRLQESHLGSEYQMKSQLLEDLWLVGASKLFRVTSRGEDGSGLPAPWDQALLEMRG